MRLRKRDEQRIRRDAIRLGVKKAREGCLPCVEQYFALAREHGATQDEIEQALADTEKQPKTIALLRRDLIKLAAVGGAIATAGGLAFGTAQYLTGRALALATWWGTDSGTQACCDMPQNFYIGRMGYAAQPQGDAYYFNINAARQCGQDHTYGYWGLAGPGLRGNLAPYDWGRKQADNAWNSWNHGPNSSFFSGLTVFADIESGFGGWRNGDYLANQAVLDGFLKQLFDITPRSVWPGLYVTPVTWNGFFGPGFRPATDFVLWLAGCHTCSTAICNPCNFSCNTPRTVNTYLNSSIPQVTLGGRKTVLWQYWISNCGCGDYNVMFQNSASLVPQNNSVIYVPCS